MCRLFSIKLKLFCFVDLIKDKMFETCGKFHKWKLFYKAMPSASIQQMINLFNGGRNNTLLDMDKY